MMSSHTLKSIKLTHSKAIKKRTSYKNVGVLGDELSKKQKIDKRRMGSLERTIRWINKTSRWGEE